VRSRRGRLKTRLRMRSVVHLEQEARVDCAGTGGHGAAHGRGATAGRTRRSDQERRDLQVRYCRRAQRGLGDLRRGRLRGGHHGRRGRLLVEIETELGDHPGSQAGRATRGDRRHVRCGGHKGRGDLEFAKRIRVGLIGLRVGLSSARGRRAVGRLQIELEISLVSGGLNAPTSFRILIDGQGAQCSLNWTHLYIVLSFLQIFPSSLPGMVVIYKWHPWGKRQKLPPLPWDARPFILLPQGRIQPTVVYPAGAAIFLEGQRPSRRAKCCGSFQLQPRSSLPRSAAVVQSSCSPAPPT
jgi:hypothetical protein